MKSMTGFGKARGTFGNGQDLDIEIEIKSVNNKNFDLRLSTLQEIQSKSYNINFQIEKEIRDIVYSHLKRAKVDLRINFYDNRKTDFTIDKEKLISFYNLLNDVKDNLNIKQEINLDMIIRSVFSKVSNDAGINFISSGESDKSDYDYSFDNPLYKETFFKILSEAIQNHQELAYAEGKNLEAFFIDSFTKISNNLQLIKNTIPEHRTQLYDNLKTTVNNLLGDDLNNETEKKIMLEVAFYLDRCDITEEIIRLDSHIKNFYNYIETQKDESIGKSLNFILQEMQREANTISAKYNTSSTFNYILIIKEEIERCREQVQNVE